MNSPCPTLPAPLHPLVLLAPFCVVVRRTYRCPSRWRPTLPTVQERHVKARDNQRGLRDDRLSVHAALLKHARHSNRVPPAMLEYFDARRLNSNSRQLQPVTSRQLQVATPRLSRAAIYARFATYGTRRVETAEHLQSARSR